MTYLELIRRIAAFLSRAAVEYRQIPIVGYKHTFIGVAGKHCQDRISCEAIVRAIDQEPWTEGTPSTCVLVTLCTETMYRHPKLPKARLAKLLPAAYVVIYLGPTPPNTRGQHKRLAREAVRVGTTRSLAIDSNTRRELLVEMLAVSFAQCGFLDASLQRLLLPSMPGALTEREKLSVRRRRFVFEELIRRFCDPEHPGSYAAFRRALWAEAYRSYPPEQEAIYRQEFDLDRLSEDRQTALRTPHADHLTPEDASDRFGIPLRTLRRHVQQGRIKTQPGCGGMIPRSEFERLQALAAARNRRIKRQQLVDRLAQSLPARRDSIRRRLDRYLRAGIGPEEIAMRLRIAFSK
jgi:predicted DNA-binding protein (UPF0251 family)